MFYIAGDTTPRICEVCGKNLEISDIDTAEMLVWFACPEYMNGQDKHTSYSEPAILEVVTDVGAAYVKSYVRATESEAMAAAKKAGIEVVEVRHGFASMVHPDDFFESADEWAVSFMKATRF